MADNVEYDKSIGTEDRSVVAATKTWAIVLALVFLAGIILIAVYFSSSDSGNSSSGGFASENTAERPAEP